MTDATRRRCQGWLLGALVLAACGGPAHDAGPQLLLRTDPASAADCPYGGSIVASGLDHNGDGTLQDGEVASRALVCNPDPMLPPPIVLRRVPEPPGVHCSAGGTAVQSGPDDNGSGQLDDGEVAHVDYLCRNALVTRLAVEPLGPHCLVGGLAFFAGVDRDGDGELDDAEIEVTEYECGDVVSRDVAIRSSADVTALAGVRVITGTLRIQLTSLATVSLPRLEHVGGSLEVLDNPRLTRLALPALREVDGDLVLTSDGLTTVDCPALQRVSRLDLELIALRDLSGFPALTEVDGDLRISNMAALTSGDLPLSALAGDVMIAGNSVLRHVVWRLSDGIGQVDIRHNPRLQTVDLAVTSRGAATAITGPIALVSNDELAHVALHADRVRSLTIASDPAITDIALAVDRFDSDVSIRDITVPFTLGLDDSRPGGITFHGDLIVSGPAKTLHSETFVYADGLCVFDNTLLRTLDDGFYPWIVRGGLRISHNSRLTDGAELSVIGSLEVVDNALLQSLAFVSLKFTPDETGAVTITSNPLLASVPDLVNVSHVHGAIDLEHNPRLANPFGVPLARVEGQMVIVDNASMTDLAFPALVQVSSTLEVASNGSLQTLAIPALPEVADRLSVTANPALRHIDLGSLVHSDDFEVVDNPHLPTCEVLGVFAHTTGAQQQSGNDDTAGCVP
jgi:hypothetical protein